MVRLLNTFNHKYFYPQYAQNIQRSRKNKDKQTKKGTSLVVEIFKKMPISGSFTPKQPATKTQLFGRWVRCMLEAPNIKKNGKMDPNDILTFRVNNTKPRKIVICYFDKMVAITAGHDGH